MYNGTYIKYKIGRNEITLCCNGWKNDSFWAEKFRRSLIHLACAPFATKDSHNYVWILDKAYFPQKNPI